MLLGLESGDVADVTEYNSAVRMTWHGNLLAFVRRTDPQVPALLTADSEELGTVSLQV